MSKFYSEVVDWHTNKVVRSIGWDSWQDAETCRLQLMETIDARFQYARVRPNGLPTADRQ